MAIVAARVDTGQLRAPQLVLAAAGHRALPAGTCAKTGTAQYGHGNPLPTDAWLIGFNNQAYGSDIAFAMVTIHGGDGGPTDGPIVAKFLNLLHRS